MKREPTKREVRRSLKPADRRMMRALIDNDQYDFSNGVLRTKAEAERIIGRLAHLYGGEPEGLCEAHCWRLYGSRYFIMVTPPFFEMGHLLEAPVIVSGRINDLSFLPLSIIVL